MSEEKKIKVVLLEPGKLARTAEIGTSLEDLQKIVDGLIEAYYPFEEQVCIVCNEESKVVVYVENPDKTTNPKFYTDEDMIEQDGQELSDVIHYAVNSRKTQKADNEDCAVVHRFVSGINCSPSTARDEMLAVKKRFGKENGTVAYHGYQSFAPGEATPEMAHEIGMKLAARLWGDRYQVIVATHLDKENHLHNHFVLNTVSFVDGIKYHRTKKDYHDMQTVSDELCREYRLSVIENPQYGKAKQYGEWRAEQEQRPTWRGLIRADIDEAIRQSMTERQFFDNLRKKGYEVKIGKSIQITLAARLEKFNLSSLAALTATDELDLPSLGEKKVALFALIPDNDTSFNFLVSILYTQLFQQLFYLADHKYGGSLPVPVHFLMDEFANVSLPDDFDKILSVMRSRRVFVSIILQNLAQLKTLFEKQWESIVGNCDEFLYLGGNEQSTHKYVSELLGKATIDTNTYGKSSGRNGNYSTNYQISGRELMTPDEVRMLDNRCALLFIRGELPIMDEKYDILKHPNVSLTTDGSAAPYEHGGTEHSVATLSLAGIPAEDIPDMEETEPDYELLSDEDIEALFSI